MRAIITINGRKYAATLPDNDAVRQLAAQFPINETFQKSGNHEFFCKLKKGVDVSELSGTSDIHKNGIYYFEGWRALSFVYRDMNISPYKVVLLGNFNDDVCPVLEAAEVDVTIGMEAVE